MKRGPTFSGLVLVLVGIAAAVGLAMWSRGAVAPGGGTLGMSGPNHYNVYGFPNVRKATTTNGPFMPLSMGDSLMTGINGIYTYVVDYCMTNYGLAGIYVQPASSRMNVTLAGGAAGVSADYATWYAPYYTLPSGGSITYAPDTGYFTGNVIEIDYIAVNGAGNFNVQTNFNGGAYATWQSVAADNTGVATGVALRLTNTAGAFPTNIKLVGTAGSVKIISVGIINYSTNGGFILNDLGIDGQNLTQFMTTSTNILAPILRSWNPQVIIYKCTDLASIVSASMPGFVTLLTTYLTNTDVCMIGINPLEVAGNDLDARQQNSMLRSTCVQNGWAYFDGYGIFRDYATGLRQGFLRTPNDPHLTTVGNQFEMDLLAEFWNWFGGTKGYMNSPWTRAYFGGNLDMGGAGAQYVNGNITLRAAPFSQFVGNLNWVHGTTNLWFGVVPTSSGFKFVFREHGGGYDLAAVRSASGTAAIIPGGLSGVPFNIGANAVNEMWLNFFGTNVFVYGTTSTVVQVVGTNGYPMNTSVFVATADGSVTNITTTTNTLWGSGLGSRRLDANWFQVGRVLEGEMDGNYFTGATPGNCRLLVMLNTSSATNIAAQVLFAPAANITAGDYFRIKTKVVCRTTGVSGTVSTSGSIEMQNAGVAVTRYFTNQVLTIDTTAQLTFDVAATNGASSDSWQGKNGGLVLR